MREWQRVCAIVGRREGHREEGEEGGEWVTRKGLRQLAVLTVLEASSQWRR